MARKIANGRNKRQSTRSKPEINRGGRELSSQRLREIFEHPAVRYVAAGLATAVLSRLASNIHEKYPELSQFLKENIDTLEGRLGHYRTGMGGGQEHESRI